MKKQIIFVIIAILLISPLPTLCLNTLPINYPLTTLTGENKLEFLYQAQEDLRIQHNDYGNAYKENILSETAWKTYLNNKFKPRSRWIGGEIGRINDELGYNIATEEEKILEEIDLRKDTYKNSDRYEIDLDEILNDNIINASEDLTTYTVVDTNSKITETTADRITVADVQRDDEIYLYKDFTLNYFSEDFEHQVTGYADAIEDDSWVGSWGMSNDIEDWYSLYAGNLSCFHVGFYRSGATYYIRLQEQDSADRYFDTYSNFNVDQAYYFTIIRDEAVGDWGTLYLYIYDDSERSSLVDTLTLTLHTSKKDFQYLYAFSGYNSAGDFAGFDGYSENLNIGEEEEEEETGAVDYLRISIIILMGIALILTFDFLRKIFTRL